MQTLHFIGGSAIALLLGLSAFSTNIGCSSDSSAPANPTTAGVTSGNPATTTGGGGAATTGTTTGGGGTTGTGGAGGTAGTTTTGAGGTSTTAGAGGGDGGVLGCSGATPLELTVKNYDSWCTVGVNGSPALPLGTQTVCVAAGTKVALTTSANAGFQLATKPWHDTDGDVNMAGDPGMLAGTVDSASITVSKATCVWTCCPFTGGAGCPAVDQCP